MGANREHKAGIFSSLFCDEGVLADAPDEDSLSVEDMVSFTEFEKDLNEHPESFVSIAEYKKRRGL